MPCGSSLSPGPRGAGRHAPASGLGDRDLPRADHARGGAIGGCRGLATSPAGEVEGQGEDVTDNFWEIMVIGFFT